MSVGTVGTLVFSYPQFPWTARGRCLLGAKRVLCSLKTDSGSIYFSGDAITPSITKAGVLVISGDVIAPSK